MNNSSNLSGSFTYFRKGLSEINSPLGLLEAAPLATVHISPTTSADTSSKEITYPLSRQLSLSKLSSICIFVSDSHAEKSMSLKVDITRWFT